MFEYGQQTVVMAKVENEVGRAGKAEYPIPMLANAALIRPGQYPVTTTSGSHWNECMRPITR